VSTPSPRLAQAWALKDACYEAWARDPGQAVRAAQALAALDRTGLAAREAAVVEGLAAWTAGIAAVTRGQMADAVADFDRAQVGLRWAQEPDAAAQTQVPKIMALSMLGQHEEATACAVAAQQALRALGNLAAAGRVSLNLGGLLLRRDAYAAAAGHYREAAVLFARRADHLHSVLADLGLAAALTATGDFDEALRIYARARMRAHHHGLAQPLAMVDESVALVQLARGQYREALTGLESARRRFESLALPHWMAVAEKQLGDAYLDLRLLPEALALFDAAVARFAELQLPEEQAGALAQRGRAQALLGQLAAGAQSLSAAAALFAAQDHAVGLASVALAQAELALAQSDLPAALHHCDEARSAFGRAGHVDGLARADVVRAQALWQSSDTAAAVAAFAQTLQSARALQQVQVQVRCLTGQGLAEAAAGQAAAAAFAFESAIELLEDQRRALPGDDFRSAFLTDQLRPYQERLRMVLREGDAVQVLAQLERYRARSLNDQLTDKLSCRPEDEQAGLTAEDDADLPLRQRLNWLYRRLQRLQDDGEHSPLLQDELVRTERTLLERARRRRLAWPGGQQPGAQAFAPGPLQAALQTGDALVEYGVLDDELFALVVTPIQVHLVRRLASWALVLQTLQSARFQIDTLRHGVAPVQRHLATLAARTQARLQQLHGLVWAPLESALAGLARVLIAPHGALGGLPFAALSSGPDSTPLGARHALALVPGARAALRGLQRQPVPARRALALGESSRLPHAAAEAQRVAGLFPQGLALVGDQATLAQLKAHAPQADVLHLACHAQFRSDNPRFSALHLHDGALSVEWAEQLGLQAATVVLSACETGLATTDAGDEMVGLVRGFLVAGAARVVATLWPVNDEATANFMGHFYAHLATGQAPSQALQAAQAQTRRTRPEPYFWAAFTLHGGW
jgi:CHAT domain-containing protein